MLALLKLIPLKDWAYLGAILALLIGFGLFVHHERIVGEQKIEAADAKLAAETKAKNEAITKAAQVASTTIGQTYEKIVALPAVSDVPDLVCHDETGGGKLPQTSSGGPSNNGASDSGGFNPASNLLTIGRDADAQIAALQDEIRVLQKAMNDASK